jgi:predicted nucleic acid-binding protein
MTFCLPDTNIVIGRARKTDTRHKTATKALFKYANSDIKILKIVYLETIEVLQWKYNKVKTEIDLARHSLAKNKRIDPCFIGLKDLDEVIRMAKQNVNEDTISYFDAVVSKMRKMAKEKLNPLQAGPDPLQSGSYVADLAIDSDIDMVKGVFDIDEIKDCIDSNYRYEEKKKQLLTQFRLNPFFDDDTNSKDREIAVETVIQAWDIMGKKLDFVTDDREFYFNFNTILPKVASSLNKDHTMVNLVHAPTIR